jgi:hypothetical protein
MKTPGQIEALIAHMESGHCAGNSTAADIELLKWVLEPNGAALGHVELYAWVGKDELGSGLVGIKRGFVPAGDIPLVSIEVSKMVKLLPQMEAQAKTYGQRIYLAKFIYAGVGLVTEAGVEL